jgi:hypothetical protein
MTTLWLAFPSHIEPPIFLGGLFGKKGREAGEL